MEIKSYRAATMHEALLLVRRELGPDAAVLHTREVSIRRLFGLLRGAPQIEVTASAGVNVPSRLPERRHVEPAAVCSPASAASWEPSIAPQSPPSDPRAHSRCGHDFAPVPRIPEEVQGQLNDLQGMVRELCRRSQNGGVHDLPESLFRVFTDLIEADVNEDVARELVDRVRTEASGEELADAAMIQARVARLIEAEIPIAGSIAVQPGRRRLVALVGPTGVGKTTTIAKLAANYRLKEKRNVGLITVDTYRIAAVEQLRTYAEIIDLPMQVVSTPREMREAVRRLDGLDLVLMDTAGRSPRDEIKLQELKSFLNEAGADEVHLVLSSVVGSRTLEHTARRFAAVGTTALILTKLDEATGLGNLLPLLRTSRLPLSYLTNGQNVPDDIETAEGGRLARLVLAMESIAGK
ncbi:MAG TPA: flagellar biosynthesis protein FlhF [Thermoguttaceae bacterium]|nr:flagellar biosynthesis protein FlhF [Thermoguttaceae bacterium]